ncbi:PAS domain S-box protein [Anaerolineales bacterium HSG6]|nr:PAS domain S-box protein [Anaerolineales bacterium HSG6]
MLFNKAKIINTLAHVRLEKSRVLMEKRSMNILLVSSNEKDYLQIRRMLSDIEENTPFESWVCYLEWVGNYENAKKMITRNRHDIYLIDASLESVAQTNGHGKPQTGWERLIMEARAVESRAPFILLTDDATKSPTLVEATEVGVADYLLKKQLSSPLLERSLRYVVVGQETAALTTTHDSLKQWARKRTTRLKRTNVQLRQEIEVRQKTEEALRQSEEKYRTLVSNIQNGVFLVQDGKLAFVNEAFAKMIGYTVKELRGRKFSSLIARDDLEMLVTQYGPMEVKKGVPKEYDFNLIHKDKTRKVTVNINVGIFPYQGKWASIGTTKDITARKRAETELRKLSRVVTQCPISIMITDINGVIEYVNPVFCQIAGYDEAEVVGQKPSILKSGEHDTEYYEKLWATIASGTTWRGEIKNRKKAGEFYWEYATISPITNRDGKMTHYVAILEDITERKRVLAELRRHRHHLQELIDERTQELRVANERLQQEINERTRLAEATRQSRERLRLQYNGIPVPTYTWQRVGRDFVLIDYNDAASKAISGRIIDYMGKKAGEMFKDKAHILEDFKRCFITKKTVRREAPYQLLTTGQTRYFVTSYIYVPPNVVMVHMEDISRYKETEQKLQEAQLRLEQVVNKRTAEVVAVNEQLQTQVDEWRKQEKLDLPIPSSESVKLPLEASIVGTWDWDVESGEMNFSAEWAEMLGYTEVEVQKNIRSWAGLMHLDDISRVMDNLNSHFAGEIPFYEAEHRLKAKSGQWKWILGQGRVVERDDNGRVLKMTGVHRDISERKQAEEALRKSNSRFQSLIETISDCVWEIDREMTYTYISPKIEDVLGLKPEQVLGKKIFDFMPKNEGKRLKAVFQGRMKTRKPLIAVESTQLHKNKQRVLVETNALPYFDEDGLYCGYRGVHQDITQRQAAKQ